PKDSGASRGEFDPRPVINRAGFHHKGNDGIEFFVFPEVFRSEICRGFDYRDVAKELVVKGYLNRSKDRYTTLYRIPDTVNPARVYHFTSKILEDGAVD